MSNNEIEWADLTGYGLHLKTFYFKGVFGFNKETIGTINLLVDKLAVIRVDKAKMAGLICLVGQPSHNIYEDVDVNKPESLLMSPNHKPPNLYQIPTKSNIIIEPAKFISQLGLPLGRYRKVFSTQDEVDRIFYDMASPILSQIKLMLQAQFPYIKNESDLQIISGPFGHYLEGNDESIEDSGQIELLQTKGDLKNAVSADHLSKRLIQLYRENPLSTADIANIIDFSCHKQPEFIQIDVNGQHLVEPIIPTTDYTASTEQLFYFSEFIKSKWTSNLQETFLAAALEDSFSKVQISQQSRELVNDDDFKSKSMVLPQSQDWLLKLCESDKNNPFHQQSVQSDLGSYKTPLFVSYQIARLLSVDGMYEPVDSKSSDLPTLLDMTAGFGNLWPFLSNCSITAFENNSNIYQYLSSISRAFNHNKRTNSFLPRINDVINENVLTTSLSSSAHGDEIGYDYILATPDFAKTNNSVALPFPDSQGVYHFEVKSTRLDHHVAILGLQHLKENGRMIFLLEVDKPQAISKMESYFYQYIHTYFNVDLIVEMGAGLFYGSGHNGNVRMHVIAGKRDMPVDVDEIIKRTEAALTPEMPIVLNDRQLNNVVQHYVAGKYKKNRFDRLVSNDADIPVRVNAIAIQKQISDVFENAVYTPYTPKNNAQVYFQVLSFSQLVDSLPAIPKTPQAEKQLSAFFGAFTYHYRDKPIILGDGSPITITFMEKITSIFASLMQVTSIPVAKPLRSGLEKQDATIKVDITKDDAELASETAPNDAQEPVDVVVGVIVDNIESNEAISGDNDLVDGANDTNLDDNEVTDTNEEDLGFVDTTTNDDDDLVEEGDFVEPNASTTDGPLEEDDEDTKGFNVDAKSSDDDEYDEDDEDNGDGFNPYGGEDDVDTDKLEDLAKDNSLSSLGDKGVGDLFSSLISGTTGSDFDNNEGLADDDDEVIAATLAPWKNHSQEVDLDDDNEGDGAGELEQEGTTDTDLSGDMIGIGQMAATTDGDNSESDNAEIDNNEQASSTQDDSEIVSDSDLVPTELTTPPVSMAKPLPALDAISSLKQGALACISMSRPQTLAMIKQASLTSKVTGYVPRLIANTQLNLYQQVPKIANDLFSLTSNIDAWLYKTFNLNFKASQSIFDLLPDFAKHAAAYYCTALPNQHVIFDVSRRSQYHIACMVILYKIKQMAISKRRYVIHIGYCDDSNFIELIHNFEVLAIAVGIDYEKYTNPNKQLVSLIGSLAELVTGEPGYDVKTILMFSDVDDAIDAAIKAEVKPFLLLIGDDFIRTTQMINERKRSHRDENISHLMITSYDIFNIDNLPTLSEDAGADSVFDFLPYYLTDNATTLSRSILKDKRLFFYLYEVCLKKGSNLGLMQYHYEPLSYGKAPVRMLENQKQEGLSTLLDTFYHIAKHMKAVDIMTSRIGGAPHCDYRSAVQVIDEYLALTRLALNADSLTSVISDNYKNGRYSTLPVATSYATLIAEYLLYENHRVEFIGYYQDSTISPTELLLTLSKSMSNNANKPASKSLVTYEPDLDQDGYLPIVSKNRPDQDLLPVGYNELAEDSIELAGYRCPNIKDLLGFVAKRVSMVAVESNDKTKNKLEGAEIYGVKTDNGVNTVLCDGSTLLSGSSEQVFVQRVDIVRKFISMIPSNNISAVPFENTIYQLARNGISCEYVSPNRIKYVISRVTTDGIDSVLRLSVESNKTSVFNFSDDVYTAKTDAVFIDMAFAYHPHLGIAPMRYNRHTTTRDHFRQRGIIISEFLPPKTIKELLFKLSVPCAKSHASAMVVTDYIDIDVTLIGLYGDFNEVMTTCALKHAGCNIESSFDVSNHNHYLALIDTLKMPQMIKLGLYNDQSVSRIAHSDVIDVLYPYIKSITETDGQSQASALEVLFKYIKIYYPLHPNGYSWTQSLFYTNYELKATPVYSGKKKSSEDVYPIVFEYRHMPEFNPSVPTVVATARDFVHQQFLTMEKFILKMSKAAKQSYYHSDTNDVFEMFMALEQPMKLAHIYSSEFKKQNTHAFKNIALNEFGVNLSKTPSMMNSITSTKNKALIELYNNMLEANSLIANSAKFIANAIGCVTVDETHTYSVKPFAMDVAASSNNVDADAFFYGYNHTASEFRSNNRQLYAMALGLLLPAIEFTDSLQPRFALLLPDHLCYTVITNQHDRLIYLSKSTMTSRWAVLVDNNKLMISIDNDLLSPFIPDTIEEMTSRDKSKLESSCASYSKAFKASDNDVVKSLFGIMQETALSSAVNNQPWAGLTGAYDVIRFSNNTNHYFIHIVKKLGSNK